MTFDEYKKKYSLEDLAENMVWAYRDGMLAQAIDSALRHAFDTGVKETRREKGCEHGEA